MRKTRDADEIKADYIITGDKDLLILHTIKQKL